MCGTKNDGKRSNKESKAEMERWKITIGREKRKVSVKLCFPFFLVQVNFDVYCLAQIPTAHHSFEEKRKPKSIPRKNSVRFEPTSKFLPK